MFHTGRHLVTPWASVCIWTDCFNPLEQLLLPFSCLYQRRSEDLCDDPWADRRSDIRLSAWPLTLSLPRRPLTLFLRISPLPTDPLVYAVHHKPAHLLATSDIPLIFTPEEPMLRVEV